MPKPTEPATQYVNKPDLAFDYEVTKQGKSGVKAVVLYAKPLPDAAWAEAAKVDVGGAERPKLAYTLPKEGRYGFRVGVSSGTVTATPPKATDEPEMVVVVFDKTPPTIEQFEAIPMAQQQNHVCFKWKVNDLHPTDTPVTLEYQTMGDEKWHPITGNVSDNLLPWPIPNDVPATVRVRLTATDKAGNTSQKVIEAVNTDHTIPQGRLIGVKVTDPPKTPEPEGLKLPTVEGGAGLPAIPKSDEPRK